MATTDPIIVPVKVDKKGIEQGKTQLTGLGRAGAKAGKAIGVGLKAAGIGLLIAGITTIIGLFKSWQPLIDFVNIQMARLGAVFSTVVEAIANFFTEGISAFDNLDDKIAANVQSAEDLEKATIALDEATIKLTATSAKLRLERAKLRIISNDESASLEDRIRAQEEAIVLTQELAVLEVQQAVERARILEGQQALGKSSREERQELATLQATIADAEIRRLNEERTLLLKLGTLQKRLDTEQIARQTEINRLLQEQNTEIVKNIGVTQAGANVTGTAQSQQIKGIKTIGEVTQITTDKQTLSTEQLAELGSAAITSLFNDSKEGAIANTIINTAQAISKALTIGPIAGPIFAGIIGAAGLKQLATIQGTNLGGGATVSTPSRGRGASDVSSGFSRIAATNTNTALVAALPTAAPREIVLVTEDFNNVNDAEQVTVETATL